MHQARLTERTAFSGQVDIVPHLGDRALREWAQDVSETGMFVATRQPFRIGDSVSLRFDCAEHEVHIRAAEVVWVRKAEPTLGGRSPGIGLRFVSVDAPVRTLLRRLARERPLPPTTGNGSDVDTMALGFDVDLGSMLPSRPTTLPPRGSTRARAGEEITADLVPAPRGAPLSQLPSTMAALRPSTAAALPSVLPGQIAVSLPPDEPLLSSEARVFAGIPATPRAVTMGPRPRSTPPARVDGDVDLFAGWHFRRGDDVRADVDDDTQAPAALRVRFDDDAPTTRRGRAHDDVIENPSILESTTLPPSTRAPDGDDGFALGALPAGHERAFTEGTLALRHLPLVDERRAAPRPRAARRSLHTAAACVLAGCCVGALVGLVQHRDTELPRPASRPPLIATTTPPTTTPPTTMPATTATTATTATATTTPATTMPPTTATTMPATTMPPTTATTMPATTMPPTTATTTMPATTMPPTTTTPAPATTTLTAALPATKRPPLVARAGRFEVDLPRGGRVSKSFVLAAPARIVVELKGGALPKQPLAIDEGGAREVRFGHQGGNVERVVLVLDGDKKPSDARARLVGDRLVMTWKR